MSLRTRLALMQVVLTTLLLAGVWLYLGAAFGGWGDEVLDAALAARFEGLVARLEVDDGRIELEGDDEVAEGGPFRITDEEGRVRLARSFGPYGAVPSAPGYATVALPDGGAVRALSGPIRAGPHRRRGPDLTLTVVRPTGAFSALSARFLRGILVTMALAAAVGAVGASILAALFVAPLRRFAGEVAALEAGTLHTRITSPGPDPSLTRLTDAFNGLLDRLQAAFDRQRAFVARASHALKTPLATVLAQAEVALRRERSPEAYRAALEDIAASARASAAVVEGLLAASRADEAAEHLAPRVVPLAQVIDDLRRLVARRAEQAGLTLRLDEGADGAVFADPERLRELLSALFDNALRYTPAGGELGLTTAQTAQGTRLVVWDTGLGIAAEERAKVLERFYRGQAADTVGEPGSGLGLAVVAALAEAHHARLAIEANPGGGTRVVLDFPPAG